MSIKNYQAIEKSCLDRESNALFFLYKNLFYKNVEAEIVPNFMNVVRIFLRLIVD